MNLLETLRATGKIEFTADEIIMIATDHTELEGLMDSGHLVATMYADTDYNDNMVPVFGTNWRLASDLEVEVRNLAHTVFGDTMALIKSIQRGEQADKLEQLKIILEVTVGWYGMFGVK